MSGLSSLQASKIYTLGGETPPPFEGAPAPGWVLKSRFLLLKEIGKGGQSRVFKALDLVAWKAGLSTGTVAIKLMVADEEGVEPDFIALMHREARRLRDLVHPNIVRVYDMDRVGQVHFMVMEYLQGQPLSRLIRDAPDRILPAPMVKRLITDVGEALHFAHAQGIVHADIKPGNIFVQDNGVIKLIDFNIACPIARSIRQDEEDTLRILIRIGAITPQYASPQRLQGAEPCEADDVFSFALLIYLTLAGLRPFGPKNALEAMEAGVRPKPIDGLPKLQWDCLAQGLAFDDADRTSSIGAFVEAFLRGGPPGGQRWVWPRLPWAATDARE
ncbi:hypothetical protein GCM10011316_17500 [Roseibium aquae]|uniref:Protein kinase domain-containing protein n=1 Tax=Roseibium aquae TaxID=1323746 RepID=A0A916WZZ6_9HYPH|nr:serine/threonine-protein kinase [Roseibium aquae]GGB45888.1 hypothetical protein GCM10011316_17500 [Roseibium aquae]